MKIEDILNDLVEVNTVNDKDNNIIVNYIEKYLSNLGFKTEYKTKCLVMSIGDNPIVSFVGHTDGVDPGKDWSYPHFQTN